MKYQNLGNIWKFLAKVFRRLYIKIIMHDIYCT